MIHKEMTELQKTKLLALANLVRKNFGEDAAIIPSLDKNPKSNIGWIPLSSPKLQHLLGSGCPRGRMIEVFGPESAGKSSLACYIAGQVQDHLKSTTGGTVAYIDVENALDIAYARTLGFDADEAIICQPNSGEEALDIVELLVENNTDLVVVDSVAALVPKAELEGAMGDQQMGLQARLMSKACRKLTVLLNKSKTTIIFINQIREKIGIVFGNPECVTPETLITMADDSRIQFAELFNLGGIDYHALSPGESVDISDKDVFVKSLNEKTNAIENKKVLSLVRKEDTPVVKITDHEGNLLFSCSPAHKIKAMRDNLPALEWQAVGFQNKTFWVESEEKKLVCVKAVPLGDVRPILDLEVEDNHNYYANGILSHNTTPGGNALKFYASVRLRVSRKEFIQIGDEVTGLITHIKAIKNKVAAPMRSCDISIIFGKGIQVEQEWIDFACSVDVIKKAGGGWMSLAATGERLGQGSSNVIKTLKQNPALLNSIIEETKKRLHGGMEVIDVVSDVIVSEDASPEDDYDCSSEEMPNDD
jgi:protein RecA